MYATKGTPRSPRPKAPTSPWRLTCIALLSLLCACGTTVQVIRPAAGCSQLVGPSLRRPTPPAPIPSNSQGAVAQALNTADAAHETETARFDAAIEVVERCEARDAEWIKAIEKRRGLFR